MASPFPGFHTTEVWRRSPTPSTLHRLILAFLNFLLSKVTYLMFSFPVTRPAPLIQWWLRPLACSQSSIPTQVLSLSLICSSPVTTPRFIEPLPSRLYPDLAVTGNFYSAGIIDSNSPLSGRGIPFFHLPHSVILQPLL